MASIFGINVRNAVKFLDGDGNKTYQGDLFLNDLKIGFWKQNHDEEDAYAFKKELMIDKDKLESCMLDKYSISIIKAVKGKIDLDVIMSQLIWLLEKERYFIHYTERLPDTMLICAYTDDLKEVDTMVDIDTPKDKMMDIIDVKFLEYELSNKVECTLLQFKTVEDFNYGESIKLKDIIE